MASVVSLELTLDHLGDAAVRAHWRALAEAGLPSQAHHTGASNRPHVTVLVRTALEQVDATALAARLPLAMTLGAPVVFGGARHRVLAWSVVPTAGLLDLHAAVHDAAGPGDDAPHTTPGTWTAHVTLARRVPLDRVGEALDVLAGVGAEDLEVCARALRRWDAATKTVTTVAGHDTLEGC